MDLLFNFTNLCHQKSLIPNSRGLDIINPLHKTGSITDRNNYRGICLSSALLKIVCFLMNQRIQEFCANKNLIDKNQINFRNNHRTGDHLLTLKTIVKRYVTIGKKKLYVCFLDLTKAFDSVWHEGLFCKLKTIGITGNLLELLKYIYKKN